jgi:FkbM family methyltransferase
MDLRHNALSLFKPDLDLPVVSNGLAWDIGCNIGLWSIAAAQAGARIHAFDISARAVDLLRRTAETNNLAITPHLGTLHADRPFTFGPLLSSHTENKPASGALASMDFAAAAEKWGTPQAIKMDIEGGEADFLNSVRFRDWLTENRIQWIVEIHTALDAQLAPWPDMQKIDENHFRFPRQ